MQITHQEPKFLLLKTDVFSKDADPRTGFATFVPNYEVFKEQDYILPLVEKGGLQKFAHFTDFNGGESAKECK
jgi:hypothetical protein